MGLGIWSASVVLPGILQAENSPGNTITLGFIGIGKQGTYLLRAFLNEPGTRVLAVCDVDRLKRERARRITNDFYARDRHSGLYQGCEEYEDFRDLVARDDIDAVVIATPDHWHAIPAIEAARSGKDIYCEKPLSQTIIEGKRMVEAVRRYGRIFQTGSMQRSYQQFRFACELVRNGYIGNIQSVTVDVGGPPILCDLPPEEKPGYLNWDLWLGPALWRPYNAILSPHISKDIFPHWRDYRAFGGGGMTDWGAHHFDITQWALGMDQSGPTTIHPPDNRQFPVLTYQYANGVTMTRDTFDEGHGVLFQGSDGKIVVNRSYIRTWPESLAQVRVKPNEGHLYRSNNHYADFLQSVRDRTRPICDVTVGYRSVSVCHLGNIAYELQRPLHWDPEEETFFGDVDANRLLVRAYRKPWNLT